MNKLIKYLKENGLGLFYIILGSFISAVSFQVFLLPNHIIFGGVSSLSIIAYEQFGWDPALVQYLINLPLLVVSFIFLGRETGAKSTLGSLLVPFFVSLISHWEPWTNDAILATIYGGALTGIGAGLVYKARASTGGTSVITQLINKYTDFSLGTATIISDGTIIAIGLLTFDMESILFGIISLYLVSRLVDTMITGSNVYKNVMIVSNHHEEIRQEIVENFNRGVTQFQAQGGFFQEDKEVLMIVVQEREYRLLEYLVQKIDSNAFIVVMPASTVRGRGFSLEQLLTTMAEPPLPYEDEVLYPTYNHLEQEMPENPPHAKSDISDHQDS